MQDTLICPICENVMQFSITKEINRKCVNNPNHMFILRADKNTNNVKYLKCSLNPYYTMFVEVDYDEDYMNLILFKNSVSNLIKIPKMKLDFPNLTAFKKEIQFYVMLS